MKLPVTIVVDMEDVTPLCLRVDRNVPLNARALVGIHSNQQTHFTVKDIKHPALRLLSMWLLFMASLPDGTLKEGVSI